MTTSQKWIRLAVAVGFAAVATAQDHASHAPAPGRAPFSHDIPQMDGSKLKMTVVEVVYQPGGSTPPHSHPCPVIGHVVEGSIRMQVKGEPEATLKAGESFYEAPNGLHVVSANASQTERARFVVTFLCDHETPLTVRSPEAAK